MLEKRDSWSQAKPPLSPQALKVLLHVLLMLGCHPDPSLPLQHFHLFHPLIRGFAVVYVNFEVFNYFHIIFGWVILLEPSPCSQEFSLGTLALLL